MTSVSYLRAWYHCHPKDSDTLSDALFAKGVWSVTAHTDTDSNTRLEAISELDIDHSTAQSVETVTDSDWLSAATCTQTETLIIGGFEIIPIGQSAEHPDKIPLYINPEAVFGDGHHPSTAICGQYLQTLNTTPQSVMDIGTGSGILALMAKQVFPTARVTGIDNDPAAIPRANDNSHANTLLCTFYAADALTQVPESPSDLVFANLPTDIQLALAPKLSQWVTPGGTVILSGIWETWQQTVLTAYLSAGFLLIEETLQDQWCGFVLQRREIDS
jgi:ribosomal protein L11 methyltransferase